MKSLHRPDLWCWSTFDQDRNIDFNSYLWQRPEGNVLVDPLPLSDHDRAHLTALGGAAWIVITNSDHIRDSANLAQQFGAKVAGPAGEKGSFGVACDRWLSDGDEVVPGLAVLEMLGSKTPGELALVLAGHTLITGDLVRAQRGGALNLLPAAKLADATAARTSVARLLELSSVEAVLVGDGWPIFRDGLERLRELYTSL